jgi:hypothetical protein
MIKLKDILKEATLTEKKYYVTYNLGRGRGKDLEKEFDQKTFKSTNKPKVFNSYSDAKKYAEKMEKMFQHSIGGGTAYWVSDEKMNPIKEYVNEAPLGKKRFMFDFYTDSFQRNTERETNYISDSLESAIKAAEHICKVTGYGYAEIYYKDLFLGSMKKQNGFKFVPGKGYSKFKSVNEAKAPYEVYHKSYTSAIEAAREYAEKKGFEIDNDDAFTKIGMGPRKPSEGKTNKFSIQLSKDGKLQRKQLHIQVYGMRNSYELNAYIG